MVSPLPSSFPSSPSLLSSFSVADCAWLGFDLDHSLARYNLSTFAPLVYSLIVTHLVERQHMSPELREVPLEPSFAGKGVAFDTSTGHLIKLDADGRVLVAMHGFEQLSASALASDYPTPLRAIDDDKRFLVVHTFFEMSAPFILAHLVSRFDAGTLFTSACEPSTASGPSVASSSSPSSVPSSRYSVLVSSLLSAFEFEFGSWDRGSYFPSMRSSIGRYIYRRPEVRHWLERIRQQQRQGLFLVTNSRFDYTELLCRHILGDEWQRLFDFVVVDSKKPAFFVSEPAAPFYPLDSRSLAADTLHPLPSDRPLPPGLFVHGNARQLTLSLRAARRDDRPIVFFDDNVQSGAAAIRQHCSEWLAGAVVEELFTLSPHSLQSNPQPASSVYAAPLTCDRFGHALHCSLQGGAGGYWDHRMRQTAHLSLACLSDLSHAHAAGEREEWIVDKHGHLSLTLRTKPHTL